MDLYIQIIVVACLTGMTSLLAHRSALRDPLIISPKRNHV